MTDGGSISGSVGWRPGISLGVEMTGHPRVLIVDDEELLRKFVGLVLTRAGYTVRTAHSGRDAIAICSEETFDLVICDVRMPVMDGRQFAEWMWAHHPTTRT